VPEGSDTIGTMRWVLRTSATFAHPVATVWATFRDIRRWYTEYTWDVIDGPAYDAGLLEGQTLSLRSTHPLPRIPTADAEADVREDYITTILRVVPEEEIVSVLSGSVYDLRRYTSFYVWRLAGREAATTVSIETYGDAELATALTREQFAEYERQFNSNWHRSWSTALANLERMLAGASLG
jgi:hypothetical protein